MLRFAYASRFFFRHLPRRILLHHLVRILFLHSAFSSSSSSPSFSLTFLLSSFPEFVTFLHHGLFPERRLVPIPHCFLQRFLGPSPGCFCFFSFASPNLFSILPQGSTSYFRLQGFRQRRRAKSSTLVPTIGRPLIILIFFPGFLLLCSCLLLWDT